MDHDVHISGLSAYEVWITAFPDVKESGKQWL